VSVLLTHQEGGMIALGVQDIVGDDLQQAADGCLVRWPMKATEMVAPDF
jgi:hypothetical protein